MAKLNGFESYLILQGLQKIAEEMKADIIEVERRGKNPLMTTGYVDMVIKDATDKVKSFTLKSK